MIEDNDAHCQHLPAEQECVALREALDSLTEAKSALRVAATALHIAADWNLTNVQVDPPREWKLGADGEDPGDGWCSTSELATKLDEIGRA